MRGSNKKNEKRGVGVVVDVAVLGQESQKIFPTSWLEFVQHDRRVSEDRHHAQDSKAHPAHLLPRCSTGHNRKQKEGLRAELLAYITYFRANLNGGLANRGLTRKAPVGPKRAFSGQFLLFPRGREVRRNWSCLAPKRPE